MATVQCYIPRQAAEAAEFNEVRDRARAAGVPSASLEYSYYRAKGRCRVTCQRPVAEFLVAELRSMILAAVTLELRSRCEAGLAALLEAMAYADKPSQDPADADG